MLMLVDAGNTRIKWAAVEAGDMANIGRWAASGMVERTGIRHLPDQWRDLKVSRVLVSNVAGEAMREELQQQLSHVLGLTPVPVEWFRSAPDLAGVRNGYRNPEQLGCDRFAAAIGARMLYPRCNLVIATCGTATTIDGVTADGLFVGGMILPGLRLMAQSLATNTAQLPEVPQSIQVSRPFADNTADAIVSGCIAAQAGAIERAVAAFQRQYGDSQCLLAGGAASMVAPQLAIPHDRVDNLVLTGLQAVAAHN